MKVRHHSGSALDTSLPSEQEAYPLRLGEGRGTAGLEQEDEICAVFGGCQLRKASNVRRCATLVS
jgi:hypothetical protein